MAWVVPAVAASPYLSSRLQDASLSAEQKEELEEAVHELARLVEEFTAERNAALETAIDCGVQAEEAEARALKAEDEALEELRILKKCKDKYQEVCVREAASLLASTSPRSLAGLRKNGRPSAMMLYRLSCYNLALTAVNKPTFHLPPVWPLTGQGMWVGRRRVEVCKCATWLIAHAVPSSARGGRAHACSRTEAHGRREQAPSRSGHKWLLDVAVATRRLPADEHAQRGRPRALCRRAGRRA